MTALNMSTRKTVAVCSILAVLIVATISSSIAVASVSAQQNSTGAITQASGNNTGGNTTSGINASIVPGVSADKSFSPNAINTKVGGTVTWTNKDTIAHTVTSGTGPIDPNKGKEFDSGLSTLLTPGKTFSHTFNTAGEFTYFCQVHPAMTGKVVVS